MSNKISVIIPTYKPDYYIWECLDSVKNQTLNKELFEVILVLNGDKEPYYKKINDYIVKNRLDNFKLIYTGEKGVSNARNIALDEAAGNYIAFLDDDDLFSIEYLEKFYEILEESTLYIAKYQPFNEKTKKNVKNFKFKLNNTTKNLIDYRSDFSCIGGKIIPKNIINNTRFNTNYINGEDSLFMIKISKNIKKIKTLGENILYLRRIRQDSVGNSKKSKKYILKNSLLMLREYFKVFLKKEYNKKLIFIQMLAIIKGTIVQLRNSRGE